MTPEQAFEWLAPKLSTAERQALDVIYRAALATHADAAGDAPKTLQQLLSALPQQSQRQDSTRGQLRDLRPFANRLGMYDAADLIATLL